MFSKVKTLFRKKETLSSNSDKKLRHIAFIMDGNGRWAQKRAMPRSYGHAAGASTFKKIAQYCADIGIEAVTVYAFSTENKKRPKDEVDAIMKLFGDYLTDAEKHFSEKNSRIHFIGDRSFFDADLLSRMEKLEYDTKDKEQVLNIAINYGGRDEIVHAANVALASGKTELCEEDITNNLYTTDSPPVDLIVRTGAEKRISNFLLWQAAYAELYFTDVLWPDFSPHDVDAAVREFYGRKRRYGGL